MLCFWNWKLKFFSRKISELFYKIAPVQTSEFFSGKFLTLISKCECQVEIVLLLESFCQKLKFLNSEISKFFFLLNLELFKFRQFVGNVRRVFCFFLAEFHSFLCCSTAVWSFGRYTTEASFYTHTRLLTPSFKVAVCVFISLAVLWTSNYYSPTLKIVQLSVLFVLITAPVCLCLSAWLSSRPLAIGWDVNRLWCLHYWCRLRLGCALP